MSKTKMKIMIIIITNLVVINKKREPCRIVDFTIPADHRVKLRKSGKREKYLDLARGLKKPWSMKVIVIPVVIGGFNTVTRGLLQGLEDFEIRGRVETIQTIALLRSTRILRRGLETCGHFTSSEKPPANVGVKKISDE